MFSILEPPDVDNTRCSFFFSPRAFYLYEFSIIKTRERENGEKILGEDRSGSSLFSSLFNDTIINRLPSKQFTNIPFQFHASFISRVFYFIPSINIRILAIRVNTCKKEITQQQDWIHFKTWKFYPLLPKCIVYFILKCFYIT